MLVKRELIKKEWKNGILIRIHFILIDENSCVIFT